MEPTFFETPGDLRKWLERNHESESELWVGFRRKASGLPSVTWSEAVDEALCFGWIDGKRVGVDETSYAMRFTPRKPGSTWSKVNVAKVAALRSQGRMRPAGEAAYKRRSEARSGTYSYENRHNTALDPESEREFRARPEAWAFFSAQPDGYRKTAIWWVVSAKREETRRRRLATLISDSAGGRRLKQLTRPA
jgi:uncharacterized protein YdeI (YjbR/CyaY-like superfamily)